jgi:hypothetical protein
MKKYNLFFLLSLMIFFASCKKDLTDPVYPDNDNLENIQVPSTFNWSTGQNVIISIQGLPTTIPIKSTLSISLTDGTVLHQRFHAMDLDATIEVTIPKTETQLLLKYGTAEYQVAIVNNQATFSFIPQIQE